MNPRFSLLFLLASLGACQRTPNEQPAPASSASGPTESSKLELTPLSPEQQNVATSILASLNRKELAFSAPEARDPKYRNVLLHLAGATGEQDAPQAAAALSALRELPPEKSPSNDLLRIVELQIQSKDMRVVKRVLGLAKRSATKDKASSQMADAMMSFSGNRELASGGGRFMLVDTLLAFPVGTANKKTLADLLVTSLEADTPILLSQGLDGLVRYGRYVSKRGQLAERALALTSHGDPAVRGKALELLGEVARSNSEATVAAVKGLEDAHPFVRASACTALENIGDKSTIHALMPLVEDKEKTLVDLTSRDPDGGVLRSVYSPGALGVVQELAINAIHQLSDRAFELAVIVPKDPLGGLATQAKAAKQWYQKAKKDLPPLQLAGAAASASAAAEAPPKADGKPPTTAPVSGTARPRNPAAPPASGTP